MDVAKRYRVDAERVRKTVAEELATRQEKKEKGKIGIRSKKSA